MRIIGRKLVEEFIKKHLDCRSAVASLVLEIESAEWSTPYDIKAQYTRASIIGNTNVVFNLSGNKYRLWVIVTYKNGIVLIKNIATHKEYDRWEIK